MYGIINIAGKQCSCSSFHLIGHVLVFHLQILSQGTALNSKTDHHKKVVTFSLFLIWMVIRCNAFKTASSVIFLWGRELVSENPFNTVSVEVLVGELSDFSWSDWRFPKKKKNDQNSFLDILVNLNLLTYRMVRLKFLPMKKYGT